MSLKIDEYINDISEEEVNKIISEKRHSELISLFNRLLLSIEKEKVINNKLIENLNLSLTDIDQNNKKTFLQLATDNQELIITEITKLLIELKETKKPVQWEHKIEYDFQGRINSVISTVKQ